VLSTGGTAKTLEQLGVNVKEVSEHTGFPEIMDGRVKTLHPKIHGGLLGDLDKPEHKAAMEQHDIDTIDLVVVNLYPFEEVVSKGADFATAIENIDIGGPSMVRSAAKNHAHTAIITDPDDYQDLETQLAENNGATSGEFRKKMAAKAFASTARYDSLISQWFAKQENVAFPKELSLGMTRRQTLRYGENPHQQAAFYTTDNTGIGSAVQLHGKELSYNNIHDADAALQIIQDLEDPAVAIIKHTNPCGAAVDAVLENAFDKALASDPVSAFGGIFAFNREVGVEIAKKFEKLFAEALIAPSFSDEALAILQKKKNVRLLTVELSKVPASQLHYKAVQGGILVQSTDNLLITEENLEVVTKVQPTEAQIKDLLFAFTICKHVKSNAIVLAKNQATIGVGAGQMSRVDSSRFAAVKARDCDDKERIKQAVLASDAFFPFADGLIEAAQAGVSAVIQPGGSIRDEEVIAAADEYGVAMVLTGVRHFKH
jgi:phosphoribosylaminoimidazolecarboxamide formyltransferase/IMP cyclohydrolase